MPYAGNHIAPLSSGRRNAGIIEFVNSIEKGSRLTFTCTNQSYQQFRIMLFIVWWKAFLMHV